jgi:hypothetical protein
MLATGEVPKAQIFLDGKILKVKPPRYPGDGLKLLYQGEYTLAIEGDSVRPEIEVRLQRRTGKLVFVL